LSVWSNSTTLRWRSAWSRNCNSSSRVSAPPTLSKVATARSVRTVTFSLGIGAADEAAEGTAGLAAPACCGAGGTPAVPAGGALEADAAGLDVGPKIDGLPVCLFQASHSRTSDIVKTTQSRVRRISVMSSIQYRSAARPDG
jgi:hypothetical protein